MRRVAALSVDANPVYAWFVPLCALMWRHVAGFETSVLVVDSPDRALDPRLERRMAEAGALVRRCGVPPTGAAAASQLVRLFTCVAPGVEPDDYLVTADADAWPLASAPFQPSGAPVDLLYPDAADRAETPYFPMGYIGARASAWREFMGVTTSTPEGALADLYRSDATLLAGHTGWNYDETLVTRRLKAWPGLASARVVRRRGDPPVDRVDRAAWPARPLADGAVDAHLLRPGWTDGSWPRLRPLLEARLPAAWLSWADGYRAEWAGPLSGAAS